ncbi:MAG: zeta toxin family protein [Micavibrio sp.]|nr:zeta toxin family protein [Micavibrio sp.]
MIFAGANGSGKTTAAKYLLPKLKVKEFVNADEIAKGLSPLNALEQGMAAGRLVLKRIDQFIEEKKSFAVETTLSGGNIKNLIKKAAALNYEIEMHYIFCSDLRINVKRISQRVKEGGHHVPADDVKRRYWRSLKNFFSYIRLCDTIIMYDTTDGSAEEFSRTVNKKAFMVYNKVLFDRFGKKVIEAQNEH